MQKKKLFQAGIILFLTFDLWAFANSYVGYLPLSQISQKPEIVKKLDSDQEKFRIYSMTQYGQNPYGTLGWKNDADALFKIRETIPPNNNVFWNLDSFTDRAWFEGGLGLTRRNKIENFLLKENKNPALTGKILGTFNVKYIISFDDEIGVEIEKIKDYDLGKIFAAKLKLFENKQNLPRAFFVPEAKVADSDEEAFKTVTSLDFLPTKTVILEKKPKKDPGTFSGILDNFTKENPVKITGYKSEEVKIKTDLKNPGFLVLSDVNYPGWKAAIDGKPAEILQANYLVRALEMKPGKHEVKFYFDPLSFKVGRTITIITIIIIMTIIIFIKIRKRR